MLNGLASPRLMFWLLPVFMGVITAGTIAQKYVGLYLAERTFFSSFFIWIGGYVPFPGGYALMGLLLLNLLTHFVLKATWSRGRIGQNLSHLGALLLLSGGAFIALTGEDGFITLREGEHTAVVTDYHQRELVIQQGERVVGRYPHDRLMPGQRIRVDGGELALIVLSTCRNCGTTGGELIPRPLFKQDEENIAGLTLSVMHDETGHDPPAASLLLREGDPAQTANPTSNGGESYTLRLDRQRRPLPFQVTLVNVEKTTYPGTDMAQSYFSDITIKRGAVEWPARIGMNAPLRLAGYTLYQSAYLPDPTGGQKETTVLSVTHNRGRWLPYAGTGILAAGLVLHILFLLTLPPALREKARAAP